MMGVGVAGEKSRALARVQDFLAAFRDEHNFSRQNVDELLSLRVPMPLARPGTWSQFKKVDTKMLKSRRYRKSPSKFVLTGFGERFRIPGA